MSWSWCGDNEEFVPFSEPHSAALEAAYKQSGCRMDVKIKISSHTYRIRHCSAVAASIRKQFGQAGDVFVQQRVGAMTLWRSVQRVASSEDSESEEPSEDEDEDGMPFACLICREKSAAAAAVDREK